MDGTALVVCDGLYATANAKTAHGLVRGTERYRVLAVIDAPTAGRDAGEVLDGRRRGIPIYASIADALRAAPEDARLLRRRRRHLRGTRDAGPAGVGLAEAIAAGMSVVNGLHELASEDPDWRPRRRGAASRSTTSERPRPASRLHFWSGEIVSVGAPRLAVLGTDCAVGKRTTARFLRDACRPRGPEDRADLHGTDRLDAGRAFRLHLRLRSRTTSSRGSSSTRSSRAGRRRART